MAALSNTAVEDGVSERAVVFACAGCELVGVVAEPVSTAASVGVVIVVGGPQYRVGSHRQFTLLARQLARRGVASLRFDYRGYGDSAGEPALGVVGVEDDMRVAIDQLLRAVPAVDRAVLWGLCGAASAASMYAPCDPRVAGLVMINPWVRTEVGLAKAQLRHYYLARLIDGQFWRRIARGEVAVAAALGDVARTLGRALGATQGSAHSLTGKASEPASTPAQAQAQPGNADTALPEQMLDGLERAGVPALVILSGDADLTANEFRAVVNQSARWQRWLAGSKAQLAEISGANHTFARADWRAEVEALTSDWVLALR